MDALPPELCLMVLLQITSSQDVRSLISVSPCFLRMFQQSRLAITSSVIRANLMDENIPYALAAVGHDKLDHPTIFNITRDRTLCKRVYKLLDITEFFIKDFTKWAFGNMKRVTEFQKFPISGITKPPYLGRLVLVCFLTNQ